MPNCNFCKFNSSYRIIEEKKLDMDLIKTIEELRREKLKLEQVIASLEKLQTTGAVAVPEEKRRGRRSMSLKERQEVSARMKRYWENRHNQRRAWD